MTATLTDPDGDITDLEWQWSSDNNQNVADFDRCDVRHLRAGGGDAGYANDALTVTATYTDGMRVTKGT